MDAYRDQYATLFNGGKDVILLAVSTDPDSALASWARDEKYPFHVRQRLRRARSDGGTARSTRSTELDNRTVFVIGPDGKIAWRAAPFREVDPTAYTELAAAINQTAK